MTTIEVFDPSMCGSTGVSRSMTGVPDAVRRLLPLRTLRGHRIDRAELDGMRSRYDTRRGRNEAGVPPDPVVAALDAFVEPAWRGSATGREVA